MTAAYLYTTVKHVSPRQRAIVSHASTLKEHDEPHFLVYHADFAKLLGAQPSIDLALEEEFPFAHEAGVYFPEQDAVYITSNQFIPPGASEKTIYTSKAQRQKNGTWTWKKLETDVAMGNGGINYRDGVLFCDQGTKSHPGGLVHMQAEEPYKTETLVDGYHGRLFNSVNDVVLHTDGSIWFTDPIYGFEQGFRQKPQLPCQVYRFDPSSGDVRVVADEFNRPNGLCFSPDEKTMYITDTDWIHGDGTRDLSRASTVYAFDVVIRHGSQFLTNRRVFAMGDTGVPDGIKCDMQGNVYSGCGDGVSLWNAGGVLLGKIVVPGGVANFCFLRAGELLLLNETRIWIAKVGSVRGALLANMGIETE